MLYNICFFGEFDDNKYCLIYYSDNKKFVFVTNNFDQFKNLLIQRNISILNFEKNPEVINNKFCGKEEEEIFDKIQREEDYIISHWLEKEYEPFVFSNLYSLYDILNKLKNKNEINNFILDFDLDIGNLSKNDEDILDQFCIKKNLIFKSNTIFDIKIEGSIKNRIIISQDDHIKILKINLKVNTSILKKFFNRISKEKDFLTKYTQKWYLENPYTLEYKEMRKNYKKLFNENQKELSEIIFFPENYKKKPNFFKREEKEVKNILNKENPKLCKNQSTIIYRRLNTKRFFYVPSISSKW